MKQKSDMYPLGHILHFMMTKTFPDYKNNVKTGCFDVSPNYSQKLYEICGKLLQKKPEERPFVRDLFGHDIIIQTMISMLDSGEFPRKKV